MSAAPGIDYVLAGYCYGVLSCALAHSLAGLLREVRAKRAQRGELQFPVASRVRLEPHRLKYRRLDMGYSYADLGDQPFVAPAAKAGDPDAIVDSLIRRNPDLAAKLQATALRVAMAKGAITSDDVREALDDEARAMLDAATSKTVMASAWHPRRIWMKTGVWLPSRNPLQNKRPVAQWRLREAQAA